ncbi:protein FAR1-RELATED SEQUENCE [Trifolium repens]|nr:protein FAR1-RELATED SEQUENCE [Trifolium repens]
MAQTGNADQMLVDTTNIFTTDEKFNTRDAVLEWARKVGDANKVSIIITRSDTKNGLRGRNDKLILGCDKGGKYDSSGSSTTSASKKCNCPFKIRATPSTDGSGWKVHVQCGVHNHGLPDQYAGHPRKARLTADETKRVEDLTKCKVAPRNIVLDLKRQNPESVVDAKIIYRKRNMLQKQERGHSTEMQHLLQWLDDAKFVTWNRRTPNRYNVILVTLGKPSKTFFPMMTSYSASARFFCIGYVGGNHWVQVNMKQGFPLPDVMPEWKKYCSSEASSWISNLNGRLQYWELLNPPVIPPVNPVNVHDD